MSSRESQTDAEMWEVRRQYVWRGNKKHVKIKFVWFKKKENKSSERE